MNLQKRPLGLFAATLVIAASFGAGSCELFEDPVTEEMANSGYGQDRGLSQGFL